MPVSNIIVGLAELDYQIFTNNLKLCLTFQYGFFYSLSLFNRGYANDTADEEMEKIFQV